jgi:effector-binding domain-containing protein
MDREVQVAHRKAVTVVSRRVLVTLADIGRVIASSFQEVYGGPAARGITPAGPPFVVYHGTPLGGTPFEIEICAPVGPAAGAPAGWQVQELPAGSFATLLHVGPYETLGTAYTAIETWIRGHGLTVAGPPRETYLSEPGTPPEAVQTLIEFPIVEVAAPVTTG